MIACGGCASANDRCGNGMEKIYPVTAVRYGKMRHIAEFAYAPDLKFTCGGKVIVATERGIELGEQVSLTCYGCDRAVSREQMRAYAEASGGETYRFKVGRILREATPDDLIEWRHIQGGTYDKLQIARQFSGELGLTMKLVDCEHIFGGERVIFYFMSEQRVDFRELVHRLASELQTRIEMRQVGARDEARLVGDFETCGRECCCRSFLKTLKPVGMAMAKVQKTTLDLAKVSGRCGRLKCCLRFEQETYETLDKKLPRTGTRIRTTAGTGQVVDRQILTQLVKLQQDDGRIVAVAVEDILELNLPIPPAPPTSPEMNGHDQHPASRARSTSGVPRERGPARPPASFEPEAPAETNLPDEPPPAGEEYAGEPQPQPEQGASRPDAPGMGSPRSSRRGRRGRRRRHWHGPGGTDGQGPGRGPQSQNDAIGDPPPGEPGVPPTGQ